MVEKTDCYSGSAGRDLPRAFPLITMTAESLTCRTRANRSVVGGESGTNFRAGSAEVERERIIRTSDERSFTAIVEHSRCRRRVWY